MTTFEITTGLALLYFATQRATAVVLEVGLGGRLDATNAVQPNVAVITSISYDHTQVLGDTLTEIATEKGGIIKSGVPVVIAPQTDEARQVFEAISLERNAPLIQVGIDFQFESLESSLNGQTLNVWEAALPPKRPVRLEIPLLGEHQIENAATAFAALRVGNAHSLPLSNGSIQDGFKSVSWPGRFEVLRRNPPVIVDAAHNRDSARRLIQTLGEFFKEWPVVLIFGASEDKDIPGMLAELMENVEEVIFTRSYHPRAIEPDSLIALVTGYGKTASVVPAVEDALEAALRVADGDKLVLVTGSIFIAAGARHSWYNRGNIAAT
jgi:dihydrofolate synthase/folylpolyglutamate synthase